MRIVSWNQRKRPLPPRQLAAMLRAAGADIVLLQETTGNVTARGWSFRHHRLGGQDTYAIGVRDGGTVKYSMALKDPRGDGERHPRAWVLVRVAFGDERITIVTCHAPHAGGAGAASSDDAALYMNALGGRLGVQFPRPKAYVAQTRKKTGQAKDANKRVVADLFMGDTNLYERGSTGGDGWLPVGWVAAHVGHTTGHLETRGAPLDRIAYRSSCELLDGSAIAYGRIYPKGTRMGGNQGSRAEDLELDEGSTAGLDGGAEGWALSDHLAIYFDTRAARAASEEKEQSGDGSDQDDNRSVPEKKERRPQPGPLEAGMRLRGRIVPPLPAPGSVGPPRASALPPPLPAPAPIARPVDPLKRKRGDDASEIDPKAKRPEKKQRKD